MQHGRPGAASTRSLGDAHLSGWVDAAAGRAFLLGLASGLVETVSACTRATRRGEREELCFGDGPPALAATSALRRGRGGAGAGAQSVSEAWQPLGALYQSSRAEPHPCTQSSHQR